MTPPIKGTGQPRRRKRDTPPPSTGSSEIEVLTGFLNYLRNCVINKLIEVSEEDARKPVVPSGTSLAGVVMHLSYVEGATFLGEAVSTWAHTFRVPSNMTVEQVVDRYRAIVRDANVVIAGYADLAAPAPPRAGRTASPSMRWALTHMIEETGRHAGHLDILRELIDGRVGR